MACIFISFLEKGSETRHLKSERSAFEGLWGEWDGLCPGLLFYVRQLVQCFAIMSAEDNVAFWAVL